MTRNGFLVLLAIAVAVFAVVEAAIPYRIVFHIQNVIAITLGFAVAAAFWPGVRDALRHNITLEPGPIMVLGIFTNWVGMLLRQTSYYVAADAFDVAISYVAFPVWALGLWLTILGGFTHLIALRRPGVVMFQPGAVYGGVLAAGLIAVVILVAWASAILVHGDASSVEAGDRLCLPPGKF